MRATPAAYAASARSPNALAVRVLVARRPARCGSRASPRRRSAETSATRSWFARDSRAHARGRAAGSAPASPACRAATSAASFQLVTNEHHQRADASSAALRRNIETPKPITGCSSVDVVGEARDHLAGARRSRSSRLEREDVVEHRAPHVGDDALADGHHQVEARPGRRATAPPRRATTPASARSSSSGSPLAEAVVDHELQALAEREHAARRRPPARRARPRCGACRGRETR